MPGPISKENYYRNYSVQGGEHPRSYIYKIKDKNGNLYSFVALDACLEPGPRRPFNFMGLLTQSELANVKELAEKALSSNSTIWFGHYPTSCILSSTSLDGGVSFASEVLHSNVIFNLVIFSVYLFFIQNSNCFV